MHFCIAHNTTLICFTRTVAVKRYTGVRCILIFGSKRTIAMFHEETNFNLPNISHSHFNSFYNKYHALKAYNNYETNVNNYT